MKFLPHAASRRAAASPSEFISFHRWFKKSLLRRPLPRGIQYFYSTEADSRLSTGSPIPAFSSSAISHQASAIGGPSARLSPLASRLSTAFTLIELLVVISIIAVLAALAFPAVNGALNSAKKAQARNDVQQLAAAVKAFKAEYGRLPSEETGQDEIITDNADLMAILTGDPDASSDLNNKKIAFIEPKASSSPKGGFHEGTLYDPWGKPYVVILDTDYNNRIEPDEPPGAPDAISTVVVFSYGPDGEAGPKHTDDIANYY